MIRSGLVQYHPRLAPLMLDIDKVQPHPDNYNNGAIDEIVTSIEQNGMYRPIQVQASTGYIISGNHTWYACKQLDATEIPVVMLEIDDLRAKAILVADNHIASLARPDPGLLLQLLEELNEADMLRDTGTEERELENLRNQVGLAPDGGFAPWPVLTFQVPPHVKRAFYDITEEGTEDAQRFELLLRLAGWDG